MFWFKKKHLNCKTETGLTKLYQCLECGLKYKEKEWAEKCEAWCKEHKSCNLEIIKRAEKTDKRECPLCEISEETIKMLKDKKKHGKKRKKT